MSNTGVIVNLEKCESQDKVVDLDYALGALSCQSSLTVSAAGRPRPYQGPCLRALDGHR